MVSGIANSVGPLPVSLRRLYNHGGNKKVPSNGEMVMNTEGNQIGDRVDEVAVLVGPILVAEGFCVEACCRRTLCFYAGIDCASDRIE